MFAQGCNIHFWRQDSNSHDSKFLSRTILTFLFFFQKKAGQRSEDMDIIEESASEAFEMHSSLLSKGFALEGPPNVQQALDGVIPFRFGFCV